MANAYLIGVDVLGAAPRSPAPAGAGGQAVVIRVNNVADVVKSQGGAAGNLAFALVPGAVTSKVYDTLKDQLASGLKEKGVDADVTVTGAPPSGPRPKSDLLGGALFGGGLVGIAWLASRFIRGR